MLDPQRGTGKLRSDRTAETWTVNYDLAHATEITGSYGNPRVAQGEQVIIDSNPPVSFENGKYTLETDTEEIVLLEHADGRWKTRRV